MDLVLCRDPLHHPSEMVYLGPREDAKHANGGGRRLVTLPPIADGRADSIQCDKTRPVSITLSSTFSIPASC